jgi:hypothetical protein
MLFFPNQGRGARALELSFPVFPRFRPLTLA